MPEEKATREKLLESAKKEFLEKGYMKASLRTICKNAGVTTGALYFFFQNKEDLLSAIVEGPLLELQNMMQSHFSMELTSGTELILFGDTTDDIETSKEIVKHLYQNHDAFQILLTKSQGSKYENIVDRFVEIVDEHNNRFADHVAEAFGRKRPDSYILHWLSHMQVDVFLYMLTHEEDAEKAVQHIAEIGSYLLVGSYKMFSEKE